MWSRSACLFSILLRSIEKMKRASSSSSSSLAAATRTRTMVSEAPLLELPKRIKRIKGKEIWQKTSAVVCVLRRPG